MDDGVEECKKEGTLGVLGGFVYAMLQSSSEQFAGVALFHVRYQYHRPFAASRLRQDAATSLGWFTSPTMTEARSASASHIPKATASPLLLHRLTTFVII